MEGSSGSDRTARLTPNYVLMKINRYICRSVVSLWTFPRITHAVRLLPPASPPSLQLSSFLRSIALSLCSTPPVWFSQRDTSVYLSISVYPIPPPLAPLSLSISPRTTWTWNPTSLPSSSRCALTFQVEQSISISQESLLNLEFAASVQGTQNS